MSEPIVSMEKIIKEMFISSLDAIKECEVCSCEWDLYWSILFAGKSYLENKHKNIVMPKYPECSTKSLDSGSKLVDDDV